MALLAGEMGYVAEARRWFREGTRALQGRCSHALWHGWAVLEAQKVPPGAALPLWTTHAASRLKPAACFLQAGQAARRAHRDLVACGLMQDWQWIDRPCPSMDSPSSG